jgi:dihydroorotate dehydrogenase
LTQLSLHVLKQFRQALPEDTSLVGVGGISHVEDAAAMLAAGAKALQIYTSFIYQGTEIVQKLVKDTLEA